MARHAIGVDFGGTKVLAAVVEVETGNVVGQAKKRTKLEDGSRSLLTRLFDTIDEAVKDAKLDKDDELGAIGVGIAGQVDSEHGVLRGAPNLSPAVVDLPIAKELTERYHVPAILRNDVQIAAAGEARFGAGRDIDEFMCVFVGTGIGGAYVRQGQIITGAGGTAGEIGHIVIDADGRLCGCGGRGHLEAYASRTAITRSLLGDMRRGLPTILTDLVPTPDENEPGGTAIRSGILAKAIAANDDLVIDTMTDAARYLGLGLASVINLLSPRRVILGGGVIEAVDLLFDVAERTARREALSVPGQAVEIVKAGLGDNAGVVGAALLAAEQAGAEKS